MAGMTAPTPTPTPPPRAADILAVRSRVSWGAIAAGAMVALAIYYVLTLLGIALGLEVLAQGRSDREVATGAAIYSLVALLLAMFLGGWATSRLAVGESRMEAVLYGIILWGVLHVGLILLVASGFRSGYAGLMSSSVVARDEDPAADWTSVEHLSGLANDPRTRQIAWWTLGGVMVSMLAVIVGALAGSGEQLQPVTVAGVRRTRPTPPPPPSPPSAP